MTDFKKLLIWQKAVALSIEIYKTCSVFPKEEKYGLFSQVTRAGVSIAANIAEGSGRESNKEFDHFLNIAVGSSYELETHLIIAKELKYITEESFQPISGSITEIQKMIRSFKNKLNPPSKN